MLAVLLLSTDHGRFLVATASGGSAGPAFGVRVQWNPALEATPSPALGVVMQVHLYGPLPRVAAMNRITRFMPPFLGAYEATLPPPQNEGGRGAVLPPALGALARLRLDQHEAGEDVRPVLLPLAGQLRLLLALPLGVARPRWGSVLV